MMVKQEFLVAVRIDWRNKNGVPFEHRECVVEWESLNGSPVGHQVTSADFAELSLWPDTQFTVRVTCTDNVSHIL